MTRYARVESAQVIEIFETPQGRAIADCFHPGIAQSFIACGNEVVAGWFYEDGIFSPPVAPSLDAVKADRIAALTDHCAAAIVGGYVSPALGNPHTYPSGITDQINMMGSVTASLLPTIAPEWSTPFWCRDGAGAWAFREHSAAQIQQAGADGKAWVVECQTALAVLSVEVEAAETVAAVNAIQWPINPE